MKKCPKCNSTFPDGDRFCEVDGTVLVTQEDGASDTAVVASADKRILPIVGVAGVFLGVSLVFGYLVYSRATPTPGPSSNSSAPQQQVATLLPPPPDLSPTASPSIQPSPSPSVEASPSPQASPSPVELSSSPITTAAGAPAVTGQMIIRLVSGAKIEADEVWQTGEGIWYRKGTVISLLDPKNVKSIEKVDAASPAPTVTKATSP